MHKETVRNYFEKKIEHFLEILNFDFEISRFCHSDTLKNEIPWTLTNDKNFFSNRTVPKKIF